MVNGVNGVINESAETISIVLPYGTDLTSLKPVITLSGATSVSPASGETVNLSGPGDLYRDRRGRNNEDLQSDGCHFRAAQE